MPGEANKALVRRGLDEGINRHRPAVFDQLLAANFVSHSLASTVPGPEGFKQAVAVLTSAFPDLHITLEDIVAEEDKVVTRGHFTGTHQGTFMDVPPTGRRVKVSYIDIWRVENGKALENWVQMDLFGLMQQLTSPAGAAP